MAENYVRPSNEEIWEASDPVAPLKQGLADMPPTNREPVAFERAAPPVHRIPTGMESWAMPRVDPQLGKLPQQLAAQTAAGDELLREQIRKERELGQQGAQVLEEAAGLRPATDASGMQGMTTPAQRILMEQDIEAKFKSHMEELDRRQGVFLDALNRAEIDPNQYFKSADAGQRFATGLSIILGGVMQGAGATQTNVGLDQLNKAVDRNVEAQRLNMMKALQASGMVDQAKTSAIMGSAEMRQLSAAARTHYWDMAARRLEAGAARLGVDLKTLRSTSAYNEIQRARTASQIQARQAAAAAAAAAMQKRYDKGMEAAGKAREGYLGLVKEGRAQFDPNVYENLGLYHIYENTGQGMPTREGLVVPQIGQIGMPQPGAGGAAPATVQEANARTWAGVPFEKVSGETREHQIKSAAQLDYLNKIWNFVEDYQRKNPLKSVLGSKFGFQNTLEQMKKSAAALGKAPTGEASDLDLIINEMRANPNMWGSPQFNARIKAEVFKKHALGLHPQVYNSLVSKKTQSMIEDAYQMSNESEELPQP